MFPLRICQKHMVDQMDRVLSIRVRLEVGRCELKTMAPEIACGGPLQCCHIVTRYRDFTRFLRGNVLCGCRDHHAYFGKHHDRWFHEVENLIGHEMLKAIQNLAWESEGHFDFVQQYREMVLEVGLV